MMQLSTNLHVELAELKNLLLNMSGNKRGCNERGGKDSKAASSSSGDQGAEHAVEVYDEIAHKMETL
jgi:hypothetical protein